MLFRKARKGLISPFIVIEDDNVDEKRSTVMLIFVAALAVHIVHASSITVVETEQEASTHDENFKANKTGLSSTV